MVNRNTVFTFDGKVIDALPDESIWQAAERHGHTIPNLCYSDEPGFRAAGNCRVCTVEIEGERALAASCVPKPTPGMVVHSESSERVKASRKTLMELFAADQPSREQSPDCQSRFWQLADELAIDATVHETHERPVPIDDSHPAIRVNHQACINCGLCVRACREVQGHAVISLAGRTPGKRVSFDLGKAMGESSCVSCGECAQACPTGALMPKSLQDDDGHGSCISYDRKVESVCAFCGVGCQLEYLIKDEKVIAVNGKDGPSNEKRLCLKGRFGYDYIHHPQRLTRPLIRKDDAPKDPGTPIDPSNPLTHFREASWEEALEAAAKGFAQVGKAHGKYALAGLGSAKGSNEEAYLFQKLVRVGFGSNNVDHCTRLCHASSVSALLQSIGTGVVTASFNQVTNADVAILIGCNPSSNHPVIATYFKQAHNAGTRFIFMDPRRIENPRMVDQMVQFRPGKDVALLNAMLNVIVTEKLYKPEYLDRFTEDFDAFCDYIQPYTPEAMQPECDVPADRIRAVARMYAQADRAMIFWGMGVTQHAHGTDNCRCLINLALLCGHIGRDGTGLHPLRGQNNVQGASDAGLIPMMYPDYQPVTNPNVRAWFEKFWDSELDQKPGLTTVEIIHAIESGDVHGLYVMGENPAMSDPNTCHARAALSKLEHMVVQDIFLTETAQYADVILPASAWPEKDGTVTNTNRQVQRGRQAVKPVGKARQDWQIIVQLANAMGLKWDYPDVGDVYSEMAECMPSLDNISWERVSREDSVTYPSRGPDIPGDDVLFSTGFPTASGRAKIIPPSAVASSGLAKPLEETDDEYPMVVLTGRQLEHWHTGTMTRRSEVLDAIEPEPVAMLCREDMERMAINPGDTIKITTRRGDIEMTAREDFRIAAGTVFVPFCYREAPANVLTQDVLDPHGKIPETKHSAGRVEKVEPA